MNPQTVRKPHDRAKIYSEYIASLQAQSALLKRTENAVSVLKQTGQPPVQPSDTRTMTEKALDLDGIWISKPCQFYTLFTVKFTCFI